MSDKKNTENDSWSKATPWKWLKATPSKLKDNKGKSFREAVPQEYNDQTEKNIIDSQKEFSEYVENQPTQEEQSTESKKVIKDQILEIKKNMKSRLNKLPTKVKLINQGTKSIAKNIKDKLSR